jgi:imidazolonepropionase-like amidohydrolase
MRRIRHRPMLDRMTTEASTDVRSRPTVLRAAWLFDATSDVLMANPTLVIDRGTITAVGASAFVPEDADVVDLAGATLIPGLVDGHVHLAFDASDDLVGRLADRDDAAAFASMASAARRAARSGVTTVRDLGDRGYLSFGLRNAAATDHSQ